ncbi:S8 family serine peptidase [Patescibacteria group bacterium]|nr:S8 family serine peptidase [Patescibacteria group bacterium]
MQRLVATAPAHRLGEIVVLYQGASLPELKKYDDDQAAAAALVAFRKDPAVVAADWNATVHLAADRVTPDDEFFPYQWYLEKIQAPEAWKLVQGSRSVVVGVLDTGVDLDHQDLRNNIWTNPREVLDGLDNDGNGFPDDVHGWDFVDDVGDPQPHFGKSWTETGVNHGTFISGIIGAVGNNRVGTSGVAWNVRIMPVRVLDSEGTGDVETVAQGILYALQNGAQILNLSFVGPDRSSVLDAAIMRAHDAGLTVVTAVGNDHAKNGGQNLDLMPNYPVCSDGIGQQNLTIGVVATDETDHKAAFSAYGSHCVDIAAPGVSMWGTRYHNVTRPGFGESYGGFWQGTSFATAVVTGAAALLKSMSPSLSNEEIRTLLMKTADPIDVLNPTYAGKLGAGRLNLAAAVQSLANALPTAPVSSRALLGVGAPPGMPAEVRLFTQGGAFVRSFSAYGAGFTGGVVAASGDLDADLHDEIVTAPQSAGGPHIRMFDTAGIMKGEFFAYDAKMTSGVSLAVGDLDADGRAEIITAPASGALPEVRVFDGEGKLLTSFLAYDAAFHGGVAVAVGDLDADGRAEIITAPGVGGGPHIRVFTAKGNLKTQFFAEEKTDLRGWRVMVGDTQRQGAAGIGVMPATGVAHELHLFNGLGVLYGIVEFATPADTFPVTLGVIDPRGRADVITSAPTSAGTSLSAHDTDGKEHAFVVTYPKGTVTAPNPFVVRKP